ncbi:MAG: hypothetical protein HY673_21155 [Chloroflexi bacterium]|nr:hypothetical protein [Chloroflexota bacterium]
MRKLRIPATLLCLLLAAGLAAACRQAVPDAWDRNIPPSGPEAVPTSTPGEPPVAQIPVTPPGPSPTPECRYAKLDGQLSALMYTRENISTYPPEKGSRLEMLLARPKISVLMRLSRSPSEQEVRELEARGFEFGRRLDGTVSIRSIPDGSFIASALIPWDAVCWFVDQEYVVHLSTTELDPGRLN